MHLKYIKLLILKKLFILGLCNFKFSFKVPRTPHPPPPPQKRKITPPQQYNTPPHPNKINIFTSPPLPPPSSMGVHDISDISIIHTCVLLQKQYTLKQYYCIAIYRKQIVQTWHFFNDLIHFKPPISKLVFHSHNT